MDKIHVSFIIIQYFLRFWLGLVLEASAEPIQTSKIEFSLKIVKAIYCFRKNIHDRFLTGF